MAGKLKTLFGKGKELEGRVSRRVGALGGKAKKEGDDVYSVADKAAPGGRRRARGEKGAAKSGKANEVKDLTSSGRKRIAGGAGVAGGTSLFVNAVKPKDQTDAQKAALKEKQDKARAAMKKARDKSLSDKDDDKKSPSKSGGRFGQGSSKTRNGKANVSKEQLEKTGLTLTAYMNKWNKSGNRPTAAAASKSGTKKSSSKNRPAIFGKDAKFRPLGGVLARALLGDDEKFGGERGLIDFVRTKKKPVKKQAGGMMKAKGHKRGGAVGMSKPGNEKLPMVGKKRPMSRAQSRATLSPAQRRLLDSVQGREGSKQATSVIQDLSDKYGYAPGKRAGAKGGMGKGKRAKPPGMNMGGVAMAPPGKKVPAMIKRPPASAPGTRTPSVANAGAKAAADAKAAANASAQAQGGPGSARSLANLAAMTRGMNRGPNRPKPTKATAMRGAAARRSGGSTPPGMRMGGAAMKSKMASKGGKMGGKVPPGYKNGGSVGRKKTARGVGAAKRGFGRAMR